MSLGNQFEIYRYVANFNANGCPQLCNLPPGNCPAYGLSEDCLYLSVFAPTKPPTNPAGYPVFFWIHGGAFEQGLGNCALYNATYFAEKGIVTVVTNYRLGALGFTASESMDGNYGIKDQRLAMQWVQDNIAAFGGNPDLVTVGGQSAGAMSAGAHMVSEASAGLYDRIIMESNPLGLPFHTRESAKVNADQLFAYLNCASNDVPCMMAKSSDEILDAQAHGVELNLKNLLSNFLPFAPMVDGIDIKLQPFEAMRKGAFKPVPMLSGTVLDEGQLFVYELFTKPVRSTAYGGMLDVLFGVTKARQIEKKYPFEIYPGNTDGRNAFNVLATDLLFLCPLRNISRGAESTMTASKTSSFLYRFMHLLSFDAWGPNYQFCVGSVCHGSELPFVFNVFTDGATVSYTPTANEMLLTEDIMNAWANFVTSGNPNNGDFKLPVAYPAYSQVSGDNQIVVDEPGSYQGSNIRSEYCDLWDRLGYEY